MARYSIYVEKEYGKERTALKMYHNKKLETKFDLEVIDRYTSQFKDQNEFLTYLAKIDVLHFIPMKCFIGNNTKGKTFQRKIIYNDPLVYAAAKDIIFQKKQGINHNKITLTKTDAIVKFSNEIINMAVNDIYAFESMQKEETFPQHVLDLLSTYKIPPKEYTQDDKQSPRDTISYNLLLYKNFRPIHLWKQKYDKALIEANNNKISNEPEENKQIELSSMIDNNYEDKKEYIIYIYKIYGLEGVKNLFDNDTIQKYLTKDEIQAMGLYNQDQDNMKLK